MLVEVAEGSGELSAQQNFRVMKKKEDRRGDCRCK